MDSEVIALLVRIGDWANDNQGVLGILIFIATLFLGWASGIFSALRRKPRLEFKLIDGPTFCCTFPTGQKHLGFDAHQTGIALYLRIANIGSAPSSIENVSIGYHWNLRPWSLQWLRYSIGYFWISHPAVALADFQASIGGNIKIFPFLLQKNYSSPTQTSTYLQPGQSTNGVVYFEQRESWGGFFPAPRAGKTRIKVSIQDVFGKRHTKTFRIPVIPIEEARKYNPAFGKTFAELDGRTLPIDRAQGVMASEQ
jgi:hypothetical protein